MKQRTYRLNWLDVRSAIKRSRYGRASEDDRLLCEYAYRKHPDRYKELREEVVHEVFSEVSMQTKTENPED